jgi:hypothetical protein
VDILKYFYEEPVALEPLTPDADPDARQKPERTPQGHGPPRMALEELLRPARAEGGYHRGYLAGTDLAAHRVGATALARPAAFIEPLVEAWGAGWWARWPEGGTALEPLDGEALRRVLRHPGEAGTPGATAAIVTAAAPPAALDASTVRAATGPARRARLGALRTLLAGVAVVLFPEPAHDGHDWHAFAAAPLRARFVAALARRSADGGARRFVLPYQKARSESKFYFETWRLAEPSLPDYIEEV